MSGKKNIVRVPFRVLNQPVLASGVGGLLLQPTTQLSERLNAIADEYELYRFTQLKFRLHPVAPFSALYETMIAAYFPGQIDAAPTFGNMNESTHMVIMTAGQSTVGAGMSVPTEWCNVPASVLKGSLAWYKATPGSMSTWDEQQGAFRFASSAGSSTALLNFEVQGVCEFTGAADPGATPAERQKRKLLAERARIMELLALKPETATPSGSGLKLPTQKLG